MNCATCNTPVPSGAVQCRHCGALLAGDDPPDVVPGALLAGRFRMARCIGRGGIGEVWLAHDTQLEDEQVACKFLKAALARDRAALADFKREVLLTRRLRHPHILGVYTFWEDAGRPFITMAYTPGGTLRDALLERDTAFSPHDILAWIEAVAAALDYAHDRGVLHRDVKPGNILLDEQGRALLSDFGIACAARDRECRAGARLTRGTVLYMSPEQLLGEIPSAAGDQYGLAATAYELLAGRPPFVDDSVVTAIQLHAAPPVPSLSARANAALLRGLAKAPDDRFDTCAEFVHAFREALARDRQPGAPPARINVAAPGHTVVLPGANRAADGFRLGRVLCEMGVLGPAQVAEALSRQERDGGRLGDVLIELGHCGEADIAEALCRQVRTSRADLDAQRIDPAAARLLTRDQAEARGCLPFAHTSDGILVAMVDPLDWTTINELEATFGRRVLARVATRTELRGAIGHAYGQPAVAPSG